MPLFGHRAIAVALVTSTAVLAIGALPASAATTTTPAAGAASSELRLLTLSSGAGRIAVGIAALKAATLPALTAGVDLIPAQVGTQAVGEVQVGPGQSHTSPPVSVSLPVGSLTGPSLRATASTAQGHPAADLVANALGQAAVAGAPLDLGVTSLQDAATVTAGDAVASKVLKINDVALPSIDALLASLGLNLNALNVSALAALYGVVSGTTSAAAATAVHAAESAAGAAVLSVGANAPSSLPGADALVTADQAASTSAASTFTSALQAAAAAAPGVVLPSPVTSTTWAGLSTTDQTLLAAVNVKLPAMYAAWQQAQTSLTAAQQLVSALTNLIAAVTSALSADPLAALNGVTLAAEATASATPTATAVAQIGSFDVLGVLSANLAGFTAALNAVTENLTNVVDGLASGVRFTAPVLAVGQVSQRTGTAGPFRTAEATVTGLELTLPTLSLPAALALPNVAPVTTGGSMGIGQLTETAQYRPAVVVTTSAPPPASQPVISVTASLPETGLPVGVPVAAIALVLTGLFFRRRFGGTAAGNG